MSAQAATEVTGRRSDTVPEQIRAGFYGRRNIAREKAERVSRDPFVALILECAAARHSVPLAYATEPWDQTLELLTAVRALTALVHCRVVVSKYFTLGRGV